MTMQARNAGNIYMAEWTVTGIHQTFDGFLILEIALTTQKPPHVLWECELDCAVNEFNCSEIGFHSHKCALHSSQSSLQDDVFISFINVVSQR